jgi:hypothetical protein
MPGRLGFLLCAAAFACGVLLLLKGDGEPLATARDIAAAVCPDTDAPVAADVLRTDLAGEVELLVAGADSGSFTTMELVARAEELRFAYPRCTIAIVDARAAAPQQGSARLSGALEYSASEASDVHAQRRKFDAWFRESADGFVLERLRLGPQERPPPEARP